MKYLKYFLFVGAVMLMSSSYTTRTSRLSEGIYPGNLMPELKMSNHLGKKLDLKHLRGVKVLVNFWAAYDAESRMENVLLCNTLKKEDYPIVMISVSFDKSRSVFEKTLSMDGVDVSNQFIDEMGTASEIYQKYRLEQGFKNYLIDEEGVIMAMDVTPNDLNGLFKEKI